MNIIDQIFDILEREGAARYGMERINQREHALQCAALAEGAGAAPSLIAASLLHDIGHMIHRMGDDAAARGIDDRHEVLGGKYLARWFGDAVAMPVMLHVDAKRYLCRTDPDYFGRLSPASVRSLELQGGPFDGNEAETFVAAPYSEDAIRLRLWDEAAKVEGLRRRPRGISDTISNRCFGPAQRTLSEPLCKRG